MIEIENLIQYSKTLTLLYVEDNKETRESTILTLENFFDNIIVAIDGDDGIDKFKKNNIEIVITDINMPNKNGLDMAKEIKKIDLSIPILLFSAHNETNYFLDAIKIGIEGYLIKPFNIEQFTQSLSKSVNNLKLKRENLEYKNNLENKVQEHLKDLRDKEMLLVQSSKLAAMGEMIDAIAHQWKQPLSVIKMQSEIVEYEMENDDIDIEYIKKTISVTKRQINHLVDTIDEFRSFFRPNNNIIKINLKSLFDTIELLLQDELLKCGVSIKNNCEEEIYLVVNENEIKHLFINLINNAKDEMVKNDIEYNQRIVDIKTRKMDDAIIITVKDNGKGIPKNIINDIFKPHFTTKENEGGTGIGLYMCQQIVEKNGGTIDTYNDNGAVFNVTLPIRKEKV